MNRSRSRRSNHTDSPVVVVDIEESGWLEDDASSVGSGQDDSHSSSRRLVLDDDADTLFVGSRRRQKGDDGCVHISR